MEKDKYTIRPARISDAVRIRELLKTWLTEAPFNFGNTNNTKALENIVFYIKNSFVIVVEYENIIIGTLAATVDPADPVLINDDVACENGPGVTLVTNNVLPPF